MRRTIAQIESNIINDDRQLLLMILEQLMDINQKLAPINIVNEQVELTLDKNKTTSKNKKEAVQ